MTILLHHPVHFVAPASRLWPEFRTERHVPIAPEQLSDLSGGGTLTSWVLRTCYELRSRGACVTVSDAIRPEAINIADIYNFGRRQRDFRSFVVIPRGDGHDPELANFTVLQNGLSRSSRPSVFIPHWRQPAILPRNPDRGTRIETLSFKGRETNFDPAFRSRAFLDALEAEGVRFDTASGSTNENRHWSDYREVDLVLAVRNLTIYDAARKPASKLVNAWWGEVPALLGPEPAFAEIGTAGKDYLEVRRPEDVISAIRWFRADPARYAAMVDAGRHSRHAFSDDAIAERWISALNGPVGAEFGQWQNRSSLRRMWSAGWMMAREPSSKRRHRHQFTSGPRLLEG